MKCTPTLELFLQGGVLRYRLKGAAPDADLLAFLSANKADLARLLGAVVAPTAPTSPHRGHNGQNGRFAPEHSANACGEQRSVQSVQSVPRGKSERETFAEGPDTAGALDTAGDPAPAYRVVRGPKGLRRVLNACGESRRVALDTETTGLDARRDRARLLQLAPDAAPTVFVLDLFLIDPGALAPLWDVLRGKELVGHNLAFDLPFLAGLGLQPGRVSDTMLLSQLLYGPRQPKGFHSLAGVAERELGRELAKELQASDWSGDLSPEQMEYAARDAAVLLPLHERLVGQVTAAGMERVAETEMRALPAVAWMARSGVPFDRRAWDALADEAEQLAKDLARELTEAAPPRPGDVPWNWNSPKQVQEVFAAVGVPLTSTGDEALAASDHPLAGLLRRYRAAAKLASTYGRTWAEKATCGGRVFTDWKQIGAITGRMACGHKPSGRPNLQNLPRDPHYRACFRAPKGRMLVKADFAQIELKIAARVANDEAMLDAYAAGEDLHTLTARRMTGKDEVTKEERQLAKPVNFGLIYGLGADALRRKAKADYGVDLSDKDARRYRDAFFEAYPGIAAWHKELNRRRWRQRLGREPAEVRTLTGRRIVVKADFWHGGRANYVVQGTGGDAIKQALALLWERSAEVPGAFPVLAIHDEIVVECDADQAPAVSEWLKAAMVGALAPLIDPVPVEVEVKASRTWGGD